ncbi:hypothetical protein DFH07DRAFT_331281 [Mycena maculata]|uniref:Uncharacterized protein n=1 Tax=Mycena maculata TaxID=230809 RepID=A0AAD7NMI6_9AGAR|nr:hypothetical protein DFH07DRAFT_331281 [Mycena maculata]
MRLWKPLIHLIGTGILNANVAFLSVNSVDTLTNSGRHSLVQIFSYLSIVASMGSVILALLLVHQNRTKFHESASDLSASLHTRIRETGGLNLLAIISPRSHTHSWSGRRSYSSPPSSRHACESRTPSRGRPLASLLRSSRLSSYGAFGTLGRWASLPLSLENRKRKKRWTRHSATHCCRFRLVFRPSS